MIKKIEISETSTFGNTTTAIIDLSEELITKKGNENLITQKKFLADYDKIQKLIKDYTIFWKDTYQKTSIIDGKIIKIKIYANNDFYTYNFANDFPYNYNEFIDKLKELTNYDI